MLGQGQFSDFEEYRRERALVDAIFVDWMASPTPPDSARSSPIGLAGMPKRYFVRDALDHVFNHQTHHRGQVSQILDELGIKHDFSNLIDSAEIPRD